MRWLTALFLFLATPLLAQQDDRGFLTGLIEDAVSDLGREVRLIGFEGALSSSATVDLITIADDEGVWLEIEDVALQWDRSALFSGEIDIGELRAGRIGVLRVPKSTSGPDLPEAEATPFALPELPVAVRINDIVAEQIELSEDFLGEPLTARFEGNVALAEGAGVTELRLERTDGKTGRFVVDASYANLTRQLTLNLLMEEGENGVAARVLGLPGRPSVRLAIAGDAPLDDFAATLALSTDGEERVSGDFSIQAFDPQEDGVADRAFDLDISGDLQPLLLDRYDRFFGARSQLKLTGIAHDDGRLTLEALEIASEQLTLQGAATIGPDGWPEGFDIRGTLGSEDGDLVLLPLTGEETQVRSMDLELVYDAAQGDGWAGRFVIDTLVRPSIGIEQLSLTGLGTIIPGNGDARGVFTADFLYGATGLAVGDPALAQALGQDASGRIVITAAEDEPVELRDFTFTGAGIEARLGAVLNGSDDRFRTDFEATVRAGDFSRFSGLAGRDLGGSGVLELEGSTQPLDGIFDLDVSALSQNLSLDLDQVDPLLAGDSRLTFTLDRDETGTRLSDLVLEGEALSAEAEAELTGETVTATLAAEIKELGLMTPDLSGPGTLAADVATDAEGRIVLDANMTAPALELATDVVGVPQDGGGYEVTGDATLTASDLSRYAGLIGQRVGGAITLRADGRFDTETGAATAGIGAETRSIRIGPAGLDPILAGTGRIVAELALSDRGRLRLDALRAQFPNLSVTGDLTVTEEGRSEADVTVRLTDIGLLTPDFSGALSARIDARQDASGWQVTAEADGPVGTSARAAGRIGNEGRLDLSVNGTAPLGLANAYIDPRRLSGLARFDLSVNGPAALRSVSGPITISNARLAAPLLQQAIEDIGGTITLGGGTARLALDGRVANGGQVTLTGPVDLFAPFAAGLTAEFRNVVLREPTLYETTAQGAVRINGALQGGARIEGQVSLGETNVQVPSSSVSALGELPNVTHLGAPPAVRQTLDRADVSLNPGSGGGGGGGGASGRPYPLDITVSAPSRIFVRGRGLDAELGGSLRLTGTTNDVIPIGRFDLIRGRLDILGQRFTLSEGFAQLQGDFSPFLRLVATTEARTGTSVSIIIEGPADSPEVTFRSSPDLPQDEVLSQLLFGREIDSISPIQAVQLAAALATLAGNGGGGVLGNIREGLDLDDFDVTTDEEGNAAVRAGKYLSENVYTDITVGSDGTSEINLNLDVTDNITARGSAGSDGETSLGIFYERDY